MPHMARIDPFASPVAPKMVSMERLLLNSSPEYGWHNGAQKVRPIGDMTPPSTVAPMAPQLNYRERSLRLRQLEDEKNSLIDDLIRQLESSQQQLTQLRIDHDRESRFNREGQLREESLHAELSQIKDLINRDPYIMVLIDGEAATFSKNLWKKGELGGVQAAETLSNQIHEFTVRKLQHLSSPSLQVRIFADFKALSDSLLTSKVIDSQTTFNSFVRGINSHLTFDFIDAGSHVGFVSQKLIENYHQQLRNCHCHQIILGIGSCEEYERLFEYSTDIQLLERVSLIELTPSKAHYVSGHNLEAMKIEGLCHPSALDIPSKPRMTKYSGQPVLSRAESNVSANTGASGSASSTPALTWAAMTAQPFVPQVFSSNASRTSTPASRNSPPPKLVTEIQRNKFGQRIDAVDNTIPYQELQRIKKMKLCNIYYLQGSSCCNGNCGHSHTYPLKSHEKNILREVARMTPCYYKLDCSDPSCIYGHRCPQSKPGQDNCYYEDKCRFFGWGHGIEEKIVKTTNVKG